MNPFFRPQLATAQHDRHNRTATRLRLIADSSLGSTSGPRAYLARRDLAHRRRQRHAAAHATFQRCYEHLCRRVARELEALPPELRESAFGFWLKNLSAPDLPQQGAMTLRRVVRGEVVPELDANSRDEPS